jgi:hypothetical protein
MKKLTLFIIFAFILTACDTFAPPPQPFPVWTPIPSRTPSIVTPTPIILSPTPIILTPVTPTISETPTSTATFTPEPPTQTASATPPTPVQSLQVTILGCNTGLDITHGMGEVTNAYVTVTNTGTVDLPNTCAMLRAIDEGPNAHPDKTKCVANLPVNNQVTLKLTVDSTFKQDTIIQVDASSNDALLLRVDRQSCRDIDLFGGAPSDVGMIKPVQ